MAIAVLLIANLGIVAWLLLRHAAAPDAAPGPAPTLPAAQAEAAAPSPGPGAPVAMSTAAAAAAPAPRSVMTTPAAAPVPTLAASAAREAPAPAAAAAHSATAADATAEPASNPDDFAPAAEPPASGGLGRVKRGTDSGVPLYQQLSAAPGSRIPQLRLDLHAYAERAEDRWVLVNMHKLREGDTLQGVHVDRITPDGAVLSYQGSQFLLTRE